MSQATHAERTHRRSWAVFFVAMLAVAVLAILLDLPSVVSIPLALVSGVAVGVVCGRRLKRSQAALVQERDGDSCTSCGHTLAGATRCPECGKEHE